MKNQKNSLKIQFVKITLCTIEKLRKFQVDMGTFYFFQACLYSFKIKFLEKKIFIFFEKFHKLVFEQKVKNYYPLCIIYRWKGNHFL